MPGPMTRELFSGAHGLLQAVRDNHGVDPVIWIILKAVSLPALSYSCYRIGRALSREGVQEVVFWSVFLSFSLVAPYIYIMLFGRNLPWWAYAGVCLLLGQNVYFLMRRLRRKTQCSRS